MRSKRARKGNLNSENLTSFMEILHFDWRAAAAGPLLPRAIETPKKKIFVNFENLTPRRGGVQNLFQNLHAETMGLNPASVVRHSNLGNCVIEISFSNSKNKENKKVF